MNLIPVIAKSDTLTEEEVVTFKKRLLDEFAFHNISIFKPAASDLDDQETISECQEILTKIPFAVVGSDTEIEVSPGKVVRGRKYPWGIIEGF